MKILLVSFSTRGAMGDYFFLLAQEIGKKELTIEKMFHIQRQRILNLLKK